MKGKGFNDKKFQKYFDDTQECNEEFFRVDEISWNKDTSMNISSRTNEIKAPQGKFLEFFLLNTLKTTF